MKALVLSGGSVRGVAYIGMLKALNEAGYEFDMYGGTSAGAIMASLLAAGYTPHEIEQKILTLITEQKSQVFDVAYRDIARLPLQMLLKRPLSFNGLFRGRGLQSVFAQWLAEKGVTHFSDYKKLCFVSAVNVQNAQETLFSNCTAIGCGFAPTDDDPEQLSSTALVADAVRASLSLPLIFKPYKIGTQYFVDGGVRSNFPILKAQSFGATAVFGANLWYDGRQERGVQDHGPLVVLSQVFDIMIKDQFSADRELFLARNADKKDSFVFHQMQVHAQGVFDFRAVPVIIQQGYDQTKIFLDQNRSVCDTLFGVSGQTRSQQTHS